MSTTLGTLVLDFQAPLDPLQRDLDTADRLIRRKYQEWQQLAAGIKIPSSAPGTSTQTPKQEYQARLQEQRLAAQQQLNIERVAVSAQIAEQQRLTIELKAHHQARAQSARIASVQQLSEQRLATQQQLNDLASLNRERIAQEREARAARKREEKSTAPNKVDTFLASTQEYFAKSSGSIAQIERMSSSVMKLGSAFAGLSIAVAVGGSIAGFGAEAIKASSEIEKLQNRLTQTTGSFSKGKQRFSDLSSEADTLKISRSAALSTGAAISGATFGTDLQGAPADRMTSQLLEFSKLRGQTADEAKGTQIAIRQILSKSRVSAQELNQLGESGGIGDARTIGARAMGMNLQQFVKAQESSAGIDTQKFVQKFLAQGVVDAQLTKSQSLNSIDSKEQGLSSQAEKFQATVGAGISPAYTTGVEALTGAMKLLTIGVEIGSKVLVGLAVVSIPTVIGWLGKMTVASYGAVGGMTGLGAVAGKVFPMLGKFVLLYAFGEALGFLSKRLQSSTKDIDDQIESLEKLVKNYNELNGSKPELPKAQIDSAKGNFRNKDGSVDIGKTLLLAGERTATTIPFINQKVLGVKDSFQKEQDDLINAVSKQSQPDPERDKVFDRSKVAIARSKQIDEELIKLDTQRSGLSLTNPDDVSKSKSINSQVNKLYQERTEVDKNIAAPQSILDGRIKIYEQLKEKIKEKLDKGEYTKELLNTYEMLDPLLDGAKKKQDDYNKSIQTTTNNVSKWAYDVSLINTEIATLSERSTLMSSNLAATRSRDYQSGTITKGQAEARADRDKQSVKIFQSQEIEKTIDKLDAKLEQLGEGTAKRLAKAYNIPANASQGQIQKIADSTSNNLDKSGLSVLADRAKLVQDLRLNNNEIVVAQDAVKAKIKEQSKSIAEYYDTTTRKTIELNIDIERTIGNLKAQDLTGKLKSSLGGVNDSFSNYLSSMLDVMTEVGKQFTSEKDRQSKNAALQGKQIDEAKVYKEKKESLYQDSSSSPEPLPPSKSSGSGLINPVSGKMTSGFGYRIHPVTGKRRFHAGIDLAVPSGTSVKSAGDGVVKFAGEQRGYGGKVEIQHPNGESTVYAHLREIGVKAGQQVTQGMQIGLSGGAKGEKGAGTSTGAHLHFETRNKQGEAVDPKVRLRQGGSIASAVAASVTKAKVSVPKVSPANTGGYANITSTFYTPGEGDLSMEGGKVDMKGKYIDRNSRVLATRTTDDSRVGGMPYGSIVEIRNPKNGKTTRVKVVDRGPLRPGVDTDLTPIAAKDLGIVADGRPKLQMRVISTPKTRKASYEIGTGIGRYDKRGNYIGPVGRQIDGGGDMGDSIPTAGVVSDGLIKALLPQGMARYNRKVSEHPPRTGEGSLASFSDLDRAYRSTVRNNKSEQELNDRTASFEQANARNTAKMRKREAAAARVRAERSENDAMVAKSRADEDTRMGSGPDSIAKSRAIANTKNKRDFEDLIKGLDRDLDDAKSSLTQQQEFKAQLTDKEIESYPDPGQRAIAHQLKRELPQGIKRTQKRIADLTALKKRAAANREIILADTARKFTEEVEKNAIEQRGVNVGLNSDRERLNAEAQTAKLGTDPLDALASSSKLGSEEIQTTINARQRRDEAVAKLKADLQSKKISPAQFDGMRAKVNQNYQATKTGAQTKATNEQRAFDYNVDNTYAEQLLTQKEGNNSIAKSRYNAAELTDKTSPYPADSTLARKTAIALTENLLKLDRELLSIEKERQRYEGNPRMVANLKQQEQTLVLNAEIERENIKAIAEIEANQNKIARDNYRTGERSNVNRSYLSIQQAQIEGKRFMGQDTIGDEYNASLVSRQTDYQEKLQALNAQKAAITGTSEAAIEARSNIDLLIANFKTLNDVELNNLARSLDPVNQALSETQKQTRSVLGEFISTGKFDIMSIIRKPFEVGASQYLDKAVGGMFSGLFRSPSEVYGPPAPGGGNGGFDLGGLLGGLFGGMFAQGGIIGHGRSQADDQLILAQRGEAILTHQGVDNLGGKKMIDFYNHTRIPKFAEGGMIGGNGVVDIPVMPAARSMQSSSKLVDIPTQSSRSSQSNDKIDIHVTGDFDKPGVDSLKGKAMLNAIEGIVENLMVKNQRSRMGSFG